MLVGHQLGEQHLHIPCLTWLAVRIVGNLLTHKDILPAAFLPLLCSWLATCPTAIATSVPTSASTPTLAKIIQMLHVALSWKM